MFILRDYQEEAVTLGVEYFKSKSKKKPIMVAPTGAGKSLYIAEMAKRLGKQVLVLQPNVELLKQNYAKYQTVTKDSDLPKASIYSAGAGKKEIGQVIFATIGSIYKRPYLFEHILHCIVDECHLVPPMPRKSDGQYVQEPSMYMKFFMHHKKMKVLGLTASPLRMYKHFDLFREIPVSENRIITETVPRFFNQILHIVQVRDLYEQGYLAPIKYIKLGFDGRYLKFNTTGADYTAASVEQALKANDVINKIPNVIQQAFSKGRKACLVFVSTIADAVALADSMEDAAYVHSKMSNKDRADVIEAFKAGMVKTVFNVGILTTGFDYPQLDTIILGRPISSLVLYMQIIGRGSRIAAGKENCAFVDLCGTINKYGRIEDLEYYKDPFDKWQLKNHREIISATPICDIGKSVQW